MLFLKKVVKLATAKTPKQCRPAFKCHYPLLHILGNARTTCACLRYDKLILSGSDIAVLPVYRQGESVLQTKGKRVTAQHSCLECKKEGCSTNIM